MKESVLEKAVLRDERICFGIVWFDNEKDAKAYDREVRKRGSAYNGGDFHGMPCGREKLRDMEKDGKKLYAVTH